MTTPTQVNPLVVFSGKCRKCDVGQPVGFTDMRGEALYTGDIVVTFTVRERDEAWLDYFPDGLTVVVNDQYRHHPEGAPLPDSTPYSDGYVMGIRSVPMDEPGQWRVLRVKPYADVIEGEHWPAYGFSYRALAPFTTEES
ncbi:MAG TPA: hypothetical protein VIR54_07065 [Vicinamibacterales bacterium]|jgi:hypothetical protein